MEFLFREGKEVGCFDEGVAEMRLRCLRDVLLVCLA